ncbi:hypothetical protein [Planococcus sp. ISL-109]|uniref:hypothetical protein n=1 Tax=Planococcus sp. ISL-109 TaxID=2819166 RepID=UPI001BE6AFA8|nr:hypothetical protein [Planococcus sp. ISL-109]MBT2583503.1 sensor histidine kinase [Planococcus sp. ISL-109]
MNQLLAQALAEHEEAITKSRLDVRVTAPEQPLYASVDGQKWWRLLDNLILNATKYSLVNSRVYIALSEQSGEIVMTIKNVTRYELGDGRIAGATAAIHRGRLKGRALALRLRSSLSTCTGGR